MPKSVPEAVARAKRHINDVEYMSSAAAIALLGVRRETLYTYVSRGLIKTTRAAGTKTKLYRKADVEKLKSRAVARSGGPQVSHALRYGEPIAQTLISDISEAGPRYRGVLATQLVRDGRSFEFASELIWTGSQRSRDSAWPCPRRWENCDWLLALRARPGTPTPLKLMSMLTAALSSFERSNDDEEAGGVPRSRRLLQTLAGVSGVLGPSAQFSFPREGEFIAQCVARGLGVSQCEDAVQAVNAALVVCAEHELSAPTFAARICASTGADLHACIATAMQTQSGAMQAGGTLEVEALIDALPSRLDPEDAVKLAAIAGFKSNELPCFSHPLYDSADPRSSLILEIARKLTRPSSDTPKGLALVEGAARAGQHPNIFAALVVLAKALGAPNGTAALLHTLARTSGWIAHVAEQRLTGAMLRPRAKYVGSPLPPLRPSPAAST